MDKKKILIVSRSFYPMNSPRSFRTTELAKEFARQGHEVTVLTHKKEEHVVFEKEHNLIIKDLGKPLFKPIDIKRKDKFSSLFFRGLRRALNLFFEYPDIGLMFQVAKKLKKERGYDLLISIAAPHPVHWGVAKNWTRKIAQVWIADCGDPYMMAIGDTFPKLFYFKYFEKSFSTKCHFITVPIESAKNAYYPEFKNKIKVIPQGFSFPELKNPNNIRNENIITFAYSGTIIAYKKYAIPFINLLNNITIPYKFLIFTKNPAFWKKHLNENSLKNCVISDYVERTILLNELNSVDFLVYFPYESAQQKPLKLIDYHYLRKPILKFQNDNKSEKYLFEFLKKNYTNKIPNENIEQYRIENVARKFLELAGV